MITKEEMEERDFAKAVQCKNCLSIIPCNTGYRFIECSCWDGPAGAENPGIAVDGGPDYCRYIGNYENFTFLRDYDPEKL